ncbi:serine--tRNA ligase [bacterium]|nr:serine--tRNA ligase [bacterium]|tara:strand:- start:2837 stop:4093 length:1257 start_codon:yes stop_codon:yes gene_type:complete
MLEINFIRENPDKIKKACEHKQVKVDIDKLLKLDDKRRDLIKKVEKLYAKQNKMSPKIAKAKKDEKQKMIDQMRGLKAKLINLEPELREIKKQWKKLMLLVPNPALDNVPIGKDDSENIVIKQVGEKPEFDFKPKDYMEIAEKLDIIDTKRASKTSGTRFGFLKGAAVQLEIALLNLAIEKLLPKYFIPVFPPVLLKKKVFQGLGYWERGKDEVYCLEKDKLCLVGTAEQSLGAMHMQDVFSEKELPKRYIGYSHCFRREAGAYGRDTHGILRVHQFNKIEMFVFAHPDKAENEHEFLVGLEEELMQSLKLPYQLVNICTGDLGDPAVKKYDIEVWMPFQNKYRETHSCSNCTDFQARRLNIKYRGKDGKLHFVHTLNGTVFSQRPILAIIENYQQKDGSVRVPKVLQKYMNGLRVIK